jgi:hypothetical protein
MGSIVDIVVGSIFGGYMGVIGFHCEFMKRWTVMIDGVE